jgi:HEAT repeat protein
MMTSSTVLILGIVMVGVSRQGGGHPPSEQENVDIQAVVAALDRGGAAAGAAIQEVIDRGPALGRAFQPVVPALRRLTRDPEFRLGAAVALGRIGPPGADAVPDLVRLLDDEDKFLGAVAVRAIWRIGPAAVPQLIPFLSDPDHDTRAHAVGLLGFVGKKQVRVYLLVCKHLFLDPDPSVRLNAVQALTRLGWPTTLPLWIAMFDRDPAVAALAEKMLRVHRPE